MCSGGLTHPASKERNTVNRAGRPSADRRSADAALNKRANPREAEKGAGL